MKIVVLDGYTENPGDLSWDGFEKLGSLTVYDRTAPKDIVARIGNAEVVIVNKTPITKQVIQACPSIRYIGILATGYNIVDVDAAKQKDITVSNIPTYGTTAVAQFVFALLLEICHHVQSHATSVAEGEWTNCPDFSFWNFPLIELASKTMGIIGFGRIGQNTAQIAKAFGMQVLAYDEHPKEEAKTFGTYVTLDELLQQSDIISLHCPLLPSTQGIINARSISKMKDGVILINTSRGPLLAEQDVADALNSGKIYAAGLDVVSVEPIQPDNPLLKAQNCLITPHIAWAPLESRARLMNIAVENLSAFIKGSPVNVVNP
ncbi:MAG: D-2-hydroxyacid dehydrogenase [Oscillospiraceae bacterium]